MKINGREAMYRTFKGANVAVRLLNNDTEEIYNDVIYLDGDKWTGDQDIKCSARNYIEQTRYNVTFIKVLEIKRVSYRVGMYLDEFIKHGMYLDEDLKPIEPEGNGG